MSRSDSVVKDLPPAICLYCGEPIPDEGRDCPARRDGRCRPRVPILTPVPRRRHRNSSRRRCCCSASRNPTTRPASTTSSTSRRRLSASGGASGPPKSSTSRPPTSSGTTAAARCSGSSPGRATGPARPRSPRRSPVHPDRGGPPRRRRRRPARRPVGPDPPPVGHRRRRRPPGAQRRRPVALPVVPRPPPDVGRPPRRCRRRRAGHSPVGRVGRPRHVPRALPGEPHSRGAAPGAGPRRVAVTVETYR